MIGKPHLIVGEQMQGIHQISFGPGLQAFGDCSCGQEFPAREASHFSKRVYHAADGRKAVGSPNYRAAAGPYHLFLSCLTTRGHTIVFFGAGREPATLTLELGPDGALTWTDL
jgi:hypothetical protein